MAEYSKPPGVREDGPAACFDSDLGWTGPMDANG